MVSMRPYRPRPREFRKMTAGVAAATIALAGLTAPQALAQEPGTEPVTGEEIAEGLKEVSFESSEGTEFLPGETITLTADKVGEDIEIRNAYIELAPGVSTVKWDIQRGVNEEGLPTLTITAPDAPGEQFGERLDYGTYTVHLRTSKWNSYKFDIEFVEEKTPEPVNPIDLSSDIDFKELSSAFRSSSL